MEGSSIRTGRKIGGKRANLPQNGRLGIPTPGRLRGLRAAKEEINLTLNEQVRQWLTEGDYENVLKAVARRKEPDDDLLILEAEARNLRGEIQLRSGEAADRQIRDDARDTLRKLTGLRERQKKNPEWNLQMGRALCLRDWKSEALPYFQVAKAMGGDVSEAERREQECLEWMACPVFREPFALRAADGWNTFLAGEDTLNRGVMRLTATRGTMNFLQTDEFWQLFARKDYFGGALYDCLQEPATDSTGRQFSLMISAGDDLCNIFLGEAMIQHAPKSITERWILTSGIAADAVKSAFWTWRDFLTEEQNRQLELCLPGPRENIDRVRVWITREGDSFFLSVYSLEMAVGSAMLNLSEDEKKRIVRDRLRLHIGEVNELAYIRDCTILRDPLDGPSLSLREELYYWLKGQENMRMVNDGGAYLVTCMKEFQEKPLDRIYLRNDIVLSWSVIPELQEQFRLGKPEALQKLQRNGLTAGFFYFPAREWWLTPENKDDNLMQFVRWARDFQEIRIGPMKAFAVGYAIGKDYGYIDIVSWDLEADLERARRLMKTNRLSWMYYQSFDPGAESVPVFMSSRTAKKGAHMQANGRQKTKQQD